MGLRGCLVTWLVSFCAARSKDAQRLTAAVPAWLSQQRQAWRFLLKTWRLAL